MRCVIIKRTERVCVVTAAAHKKPKEKKNARRVKQDDDVGLMDGDNGGRVSLGKLRR